MSIHVSVIIPAYNAEKTIKEAIDSAINQSYPRENTEIIVIDDGSIDSTQNICQQYGTSINYIRQTNMGVAAARNNAVRVAQGKLIAFLDSDDIWHEDKLNIQLDEMDKYIWSHTDSYYFGYNQSGDVKRSSYTHQYDGEVFEELVLDNFITTSTVIVDRTFFIENGGFDESLPALEDWKLWLSMSMKTKLHYCEKPLTNYRVTPGSTSRKARSVMPLHIMLINNIFHSEMMKKNLKNMALSQSYTICSYIAEDGKDYRYSLYCSAMAFSKSFSTKRLKRLMSCTYNLLRSFFCKK